MGRFAIGTRVFMLTTRKYGRVVGILREPTSRYIKYIYRVRFEDGSGNDLFFAKDLIKTISSAYK